MREKLAKIGAFVAVAGMALTGLANELPYIYGAQYYRAPTPAREHWAGDLAAIKAKGFNTVKYWVQWRWSERVEGEYVWDDLDELMVLAERTISRSSSTSSSTSCRSGSRGSIPMRSWSIATGGGSGRRPRRTGS